MASLAPPAPTSNKAKACLSCTTSKRKCSKHVPSCRRCVIRGLECKYPAAKPTTVWESLTPSDQHGDFPSLTNALRLEQTSEEQLEGADFPSEPWLPLQPASPMPRNMWFLEPDYWDMSHRPVQPTSRVIDVDAWYYFVHQAQLWVRQWVVEGHSPLVHRQLYHSQLPECIQDVFTALSAYIHRTPATRSTALRILKMRSSQLIEQQERQGDASLGGSLSAVMLDTFSHLARTQALISYHIVCLFDGDIPAQAHAEAQLSTLTTWIRQMWDSALLDLASVRAHGHCDAGVPIEMENSPESVTALTPGDKSLASLWRAWIIAESVHRTYLLAVFVHDIYLTLRQRCVQCPGAIAVTMRRGLWDSPSAYAWSQAGGNGLKTGLLAKTILDDALFARVHPDELDEFSTSTLTATVGLDRMEQWTRDKGVESTVNRDISLLGTPAQDSHETII